MFVNTMRSYPWPQNLVIDLHDALYEITLDDKELRGSVEYVLNVVNAPEEDVHLLREYYQEMKSTKRLAREHNADSGVINRRIHRVLHVILNTRRLMNILEMGVKAYSQRSFTAEGSKAFKKAVEEAAMAYQAEKEIEVPPDLFDREEDGNIINLGLSSRAYNCLKRGGFDTVDDILAVESTDKLLKVRNMGVKSLEEIISKIEAKGYDVERFKVNEIK